MSLSRSELNQEVAITAINRMMRRSYFSICPINDAGKILGISLECEAYNTLRALHCIDFHEMSPAIRQAIPQLIAECFNRPDIFQFQLPSQRNVVEVVPYKAVVDVCVDPVESPKRNIIQRWLGKN